MKIATKSVWLIFTKHIYTDTTGLLLAVCPSEKKAKDYVKRKFSAFKKEANKPYYCKGDSLIRIDKEEIDVVL